MESRGLLPVTLHATGRAVFRLCHVDPEWILRSPQNDRPFIALKKSKAPNPCQT